MVTKKRRTLHQVFCDEGDMPSLHQFIHYEGKIYRKVQFIHETSYNMLYEDVTKQIKNQIRMDCDYLAENCYEVFPEELTTLEVLFGKEVS